MLDLLADISFYNLAFYFGIFVLTFVVILTAWKSTFVPGLQNITVVLLQHPSGRQTVERLRTTQSNVPTGAAGEIDLQEDLYEEISLTADEEGEDEDELDLSITDDVSVIHPGETAPVIFSTSVVSSTSSLPSAVMNAVRNYTSTLTSSAAGTVASSTTTVSSGNLIVTNIPLSTPARDIQSTSVNTTTTATPLPSTMEVSTSNISSEVSATPQLPTTSQTDSPSSCINPELSVRPKIRNDGELTSSNNSDTTSSSDNIGSFSNLKGDSTDVSSEINKDSSEERKDSPGCTGSLASPEIHCPPGSIQIRLKFLDESQKTVVGNLMQDLLAFKRFLIA